MIKNFKIIFPKFKFFIYGIAIFAFLAFLFNVKAHTGTSCGTNDQENTDGRHCAWSLNNYLFYFYRDGGGFYWTDSVQLRWNQTSANALKNTGHRYTQDNNDGGASGTARFSATGIWGTTFPNPSFDTDDDWGNDCSYANEAEITSDNANFPAPETNYLTTYQWQRSCLGTGQMYFSAQLSTWFLEWQTRHWDQLYTHNYSYSGAMNALNGLISLLNDYGNSVFAHGDHFDNYEIDKGLYSYSVERKAISKEINANVRQKINSRQDLVNYKNFVAEKIELLSKENLPLVAVVLTFNEPQSPAGFQDLVNKFDIQVESFKMRATDEKGTKITIGGSAKNKMANPSLVFNEVKNTKAMQNLGDIRLQGVVSLSGKVNLNNKDLINNSSVFLMDVLPEIAIAEENISANDGEYLDVNVNDVYWYVEEFNK